MIRPVFYFFVVLIVILNVTACNSGSTEQVEKSDSVAHEEGLWITDFEQAKSLAKEKGLPILADFSGSDWCGWCIKLDKEVFQTSEFQDYAKNNLVLLLLDFPSKKKQSPELKKQNRALAQKYGIRGYPTVLLLDHEGDVIAKTGYKNGGGAKYVEHLKELFN